MTERAPHPLEVTKNGELVFRVTPDYRFEKGSALSDDQMTDEIFRALGRVAPMRYAELLSRVEILERELDRYKQTLDLYADDCGGCLARLALSSDPSN